MSNMSGYPPPIGFSGNPPNLFGDNPSPYPLKNETTPTSGYPYPCPAPYPQPNMSGENSAYQGPGYPLSGYPPSSGGYPNPAGGYPSSGNVPDAGGYPNAGYVPNSGAGVGVPQVSPTYNPSGNPNMNPQICPSAPDLSQMEKIPGYERLTFDQEIVMPPSMPEWQPEEQTRREVGNLPTISEDDVRDAVVQYATEKCCYGTNPAKNMVFTNITMMSAFHYKLETFGERRESAWRFEPYRGQAIDGPMNGPAPRPWDIVCPPPTYFGNLTRKMEVPHTAFVKPCHTCVGNSRVRCESCTGNGRSQCTWCRGRGTKSNFDNELCNSCNGTGSSRCTTCDGTGQVKCKICDGRGQLKAYVELVIVWTNHVDDYISETSNMPKDLVLQVTGQIAFEEEHPRVYPIMHAPDEAVRNASNEFVNKHNSAFPNERILKQRHCLRLVPIGEISYMWKEKPGMFYVYGYEHKVYFKKYPQKCCCCTIL